MWLQEEQRALQGEGTGEEAALTEIRSTVLSEAQLRTRLEQAATEEQVEMCARLAMMRGILGVHIHCWTAA